MTHIPACLPACLPVVLTVQDRDQATSATCDNNPLAAQQQLLTLTKPHECIPPPDVGSTLVLNAIRTSFLPPAYSCHLGFEFLLTKRET